MNTYTKLSASLVTSVLSMLTAKLSTLKCLLTSHLSSLEAPLGFLCLFRLNLISRNRKSTLSSGMETERCIYTRVKTNKQVSTPTHTVHVRTTMVHTQHVSFPKVIEHIYVCTYVHTTCSNKSCSCSKGCFVLCKEHYMHVLLFHHFYCFLKLGTHIILRTYMYHTYIHMYISTHS